MKNNSIIYQIFLRSATKDGTLKSAEKLLGHIKSLGIDIVYLAPIYEMDDDENPEFWSERQRESGMNNPKNPYRISDYFKIDPEYGTDDDLKSFVNTAHRMGLKVMLDLVYFHCGPNAAIIRENADFIKRLPDGSPDNGEWHFPKLNFDCPELCEYLWSNMEYWVKKFDIDAYRCDVGDTVPLNFWIEGRKRLEKIKPDIIMVNEGKNEEWITSGAFDANYRIWGVGRDLHDPNEFLKNLTLADKRVICFENHDTASDGYENRFERKHGIKACDAMLVFTFTAGCVPFIYNGNEIADSCRHSLWSNRFYGKNYFVDWSEALTEEGKNRMELVRRLCEIYHGIPAVNSGNIEVLTDNKYVAAYKKILGKHEVSVIANITDSVHSLDLDTVDFENSQTLLTARCVVDGKKITLDNGGYLVLYK